MTEHAAGSEQFLAALREARDDEEGRRALDEMIDAIRQRRSTKKPPQVCERCGPHTHSVELQTEFTDEL